MNVCFRVDASLAVGSGHLVRCLVLADAIAARGGRCTLLLRQVNEHAMRLLGNVMHEVCSLDIGEAATPEEDAAAVECRMPPVADWLVIDHYGLDSGWERRVRAKARRILAVDDLADRPHDCDLLVDPGPGRQVTDYAGLMERKAELLLGTQYAILKPAFARYHDTAPLWPSVCRVHAFFGGGSSATWLPAYVGAMLKAHPTLSVFAVGLADEAAMSRLLGSHGQRLHWSPHIEEMAREYSLCDIAVGSPGTATWERACVGLPSGLVATASNQIPILRDLERAGFCRYLGPAWEFDDAAFTLLFRGLLEARASLAAMRSRGVASVDGNGAQRIVQKLFSVGAYND